MDSKNKVRVDIDGISFNIKGEEDVRYMNFIASYINKAILDINKKKPRLSKIEGMILLALSLKDEVEKQKQKLEDYKLNAKNSENVRAKEDYEKALSKIKELEETVEKYKKSEQFSTNKLREETLKLRDAHEKFKDQKGIEEKQEKEIKELKDKLKTQEKLNLDRNKEIINLKNNIKALKEEINKLEK